MRHDQNSIILIHLGGTKSKKFENSSTLNFQLTLPVSLIPILFLLTILFELEASD